MLVTFMPVGIFYSFQTFKLGLSINPSLWLNDKRRNKILIIDVVLDLQQMMNEWKQAWVKLCEADVRLSFQIW